MKPLLNRLKDIWSRLQRIFWIKFILEVFQRFGKDNGGLLAAGLAFFLVLAFVPMLLVGLWVLGHFYVNKPDEAVVQIQSLISTQLLPGTASNEVNHLMARAGIVAAEGSHDPGPTLLNLLHKSGLAGIIGLLSLVWAAIQIFISGSTAMNAAWETTEKRNWVKLRLIALGLLIGAGVLVVLSLAGTAISTSISNSPLAKNVPFEGALLSLAAEIAAVLISAVMYTGIYKFLPSAQVSWKAAFVGGALAAVAWEVVKKGLAVYLLHPNKSLYGELGGLIIFVLLVYYSMMVLLIGAEASAVYAHKVEQNPLGRLKRAERSTPSADTSASSGTSPAHAKERDRAQRTRKSTTRTGTAPRR
jgi:membrane protein